MQRLREFFTLALITLLPFHAFLVTVATKVIQGPGHQPLAVFAVWKEAALALILCISVLEIIVRLFRTSNFKIRIDVIDVCILGLLGLGVAVSLYRPWMDIRTFAFGFRYDFVALIAFFILRRVDWSEEFRTWAMRLLIAAGTIIALYGIASFFLPMGFFSALGYSDAHSLYLPGKPLAAFQQISDSAIRRIQGTFSGPNQFGIWLLIPLSITVISLLRTKVFSFSVSARPSRDRWFVVFGGIVMTLSLLLTFSRSAWIAAFIIACAVGYRALPKKMFREVLISVVSLIIIAGVGVSLLAPGVFVRLTSSWGHLVRPLQAINEMQRYPLGQGLGTAGPATNRTHEPCVFLPPGSDPSWAKNSPRLCVFTGEIQAQPTDHTCNCAMLTENWYLQIGVEMGIIGFFLFVILVLAVLWKLRVASFEFLIFLGVSIAALFLHAWEDSAVAYTVWILIASASKLHLWCTPVPSSSWTSGVNMRI